MRILTGVPIRAASLQSFPDCVATMPITNLQNESRELAARKLGVADWQIVVTFDRVRPISGLAMIGGNFTGSARWRIRLWPDVARTLSPYDSGWQYLKPLIGFGEFPWGEALGQTLYDDFHVQIATAWFQSFPAAVMQLDLSDPTNADGYHQISTLFADDYLSFDPEFGLSLTPYTDSKQARTQGGSLRADRGAFWRGLQGDLKLIPEAERAALFDMMRRHDVSLDFFVSIYPEWGGKLERDNQMQAKFTRLAALTHDIATRHSSQFAIEET